jgi:hypothetical protein
LAQCLDAGPFGSLPLKNFRQDGEPMPRRRRALSDAWILELR